MPAIRRILPLLAAVLVMLGTTGCATAAPANPMLVHELRSPYQSTDALARAIGGTQSFGGLAPTLPPNNENLGAPAIQAAVDWSADEDDAALAVEMFDDEPRDQAESAPAALWYATILADGASTPPGLFEKVDYATAVRTRSLEPWVLSIPELSTSFAVLPLLAAMLRRKR